MTLQFNGSDGFYLIFSLPGAAAQRQPRGQASRRRPRACATASCAGSARGWTAPWSDLMSVHASALYVQDDPRTRPSRNLLRALRDAARMVDSQEKAERLGMISSCRAILAGRKLRTVYQPVFDIQQRRVVGFEALIRGPAGELEQPDVLFAAARESDLALELESLCLETIFRRLPRATLQRKLFVNASPRLLTHPVFLDDRNLADISRAHTQVVIEVSEKEVVGDYHAFRGVLDRLRGHGLQIAIDDAGSGYSGLESILQLRPQYIKVANTIVQNLHEETIKRGVITALASVGREIDASLIAEGIEQPEELKALVDLGVNYGQGFLLGRPSGRHCPRRGARRALTARRRDYAPAAAHRHRGAVRVVEAQRPVGGLRDADARGDLDPRRGRRLRAARAGSLRRTRARRCARREGAAPGTGGRARGTRRPAARPAARRRGSGHIRARPGGRRPGSGSGACRR